MFWNSKTTTYYDRGRKAYGKGDEIPDEVIKGMGKETLNEYVDKGLIIDSKTAAETERGVLFGKAEGLGLKPHYRAGIEKLRDMIEAHEALQVLKQEALSIGIDPNDNVTLEELMLLVSNKKADLGLSDPKDDESNS